MTKIDPPDLHHLSAAIGWMELGNADEALRDLARLNPALTDHPDVLETRWAIAASRPDWSEGLRAAERLVQVAPGRASGWLHRAYALRRVAGGGIEAARAALLPAAEQFPAETTIPYNLACYACQLGEFDEARLWLNKTRSITGRKRLQTLKAMALADEDLKPLWNEITAW